MTDWGAHHLDIAQWAIDELPVQIDGHAKYPDTQDGYNVAVDYQVKYTYPSGVTMTVADRPPQLRSFPLSARPSGLK